MNRQRGIVADLIMYGVLAAAAIGVLAWGNNAAKHHYVDPELAKWNREKATLLGNVKSAEADVKTCTAANKSLDEQFTTFRAVHDAQIKAAVDLDKQQRASRATTEKANAPRLQQNSMELFNIITALGKPDGGLSCDAMDAALLDEAKRRQTYYGPASAAPATSGGIRIAEPPATATPVRPPPVNPLRPK